MAETLTKSELMRGVLPYLTMPDADAAIEFYQKAFGARVLDEIARGESGKIMNVSLVINDGVIMLMDDMGMSAFAPTEGRGMVLQLVVSDGGMWWNRAIAAGCAEVDEYKLQFWGDHWGRLRDPFGLDWAILEPSAEHRAAAE